MRTHGTNNVAENDDNEAANETLSGNVLSTFFLLLEIP